MIFFKYPFEQWRRKVFESAWGMISKCEVAKRPSGGRVWEGDVPPPRPKSFAFSELKLSDLVHTLDEMFGKLYIQKVRKYTFTGLYRHARTEFWRDKISKGASFCFRSSRVRERSDRAGSVPQGRIYLFFQVGVKIIVGQRKRGREAPERGRVWEGVSPLPDQRVFAFSELKLSDLVHTLGEMFGKLSIQKVRKYTLKNRRARIL